MTTEAFDDGSTLQTFEDGSTMAVATDGTITSSDAPAEVVAAPEAATNPIPDGTADLPTTNDIVSGEAAVSGSSPLTGLLGSALGVGLSTAAGLAMGGASGVPFGAMTSLVGGALAQFLGTKDLRAKLMVPPQYLMGPAAGPSFVLSQNGGILFPYTPQITMSNAAQYNPQNPTHSNYTQYFFRQSSVGPIKLTGKFTVQNEYEGAVLLGVIHLLRSLTKMRWGNDSNAGSPPPVCRLNAYGDYMLKNVPVAVASWTHDLPENVDYITVGRMGTPQTYGQTLVPTISTISIDLNVMYSREEMLKYSVDGFLSGGLRGKGYL
jgi:hypothetical protein